MSAVTHSDRLRVGLFLAALLCAGGILFSMALSSLAFVAAVLLFVWLAVSDRHAVLRRTGLEWYFLAWIAAVLLMVLFARYPESALGSAKRVLLIAMVYIVAAALGDEQKLRRFLMYLAIVAGAYSLLGIAAFFIAKLDRLGFFQHYMTAGGLRMMLVLLFLPLLLDRATPRGERYVYAATVLLTLVALMLTQTRSSWLGFAAGAVLLGVLRYRLLLGALLALGVLFMLLAPARFTDRVTHMFQFGAPAPADTLRATSPVSAEDAQRAEVLANSNRSRLRMVETGWRMFLDHPLFGLGDGEMHRMYREYVPDATKDEGGHLHNSYVHLLATHGIVGFAAMMALLGAYALLLWRGFRRGTGIGALVALGAFATLLGVLVNGIAEYNLGDHEIMLMLWTTAGIAVAALRIQPEGGKQ